MHKYSKVINQTNKLFNKINNCPSTTAKFLSLPGRYSEFSNYSSTQMIWQCRKTWPWLLPVSYTSSLHNFSSEASQERCRAHTWVKYSSHMSIFLSKSCSLAPGSWLCRAWCRRGAGAVVGIPPNCCRAWVWREVCGWRRVERPSKAQSQEQ